jgi:hypothetical protein
VSSAGTISRLEALLARVRSRAAEARTAAVVPHVAMPQPAAAVVVAPEPVDDEDDNQPTVPPPPGVGPQDLFPRREVRRLTPEPAAIEVDVDMSADEVSAPATDRAAPAPEPASAAAEAASSQERLVMTEPEPAEMPEPVGPVSLPQPAAAAVPEVEAEEEPPASSRRPLAPQQPEERLAEMAFGATEPRPAMHTPPPESGRLPAAPPAADMEFADEDTGVHAAKVPAPLTPEPTRAALSLSADVAKTQGTVASFHPTTFAELLEASLKL